MSSILGSQGLVLATAVAVSAGTIILVDLFREKYFSTTQMEESQDSDPVKQNLRPCLSSGAKKGLKNKKKKVQFAADVKDPSGSGEDYRREHRKSTRTQGTSCGTEVGGVSGMPANRVALYSGILKDRCQRMEFSY